MTSIFKTLTSALALLLCTGAAIAEDSKQINFVAIGDSGYEGSWYDFFGSWPGVRDQSWAPGKTGLPTMAAMMRTYCESKPCEFGIMLGDNIYPDGVEGLDAEDDQARFDEVFVKPFTPMLTVNPDFRIYPTLGNHDWRGKRAGAASQIEFLKNTPPFAMKDVFYSAIPKGMEGDIELFIVDTEIILSQHQIYKDKLDDAGREMRTEGDFEKPITHTLPLTDGEKNQLIWLKHALDASTAKWKIIVAHHPLWSSGSTKFEQAHVIRRELLPIICGRADAYFAGHEHTSEVHSDSCETVMPEGEAKPLLHVISGAFSKSRLVNPGFKAYQDRTYPQLNSQFAVGKQPEGSEHEYMQTWGFAHITLEGDAATVRMVTHIEDEPVPTDITPVFECTFTKGVGFPAGGCGNSAE